MQTANAKNFASILRMGSSLRRFRGDESGSYLLIAALMMPVLVGLVGLGTESGLWMYKHRAMQSTADSGAYSAATAYVKAVENGQTITKFELEAQTRAVATTYGYVNGANNVTVTVNWPFGGDNNKVEVVVSQPQVPLFSGVLRALTSPHGGGSNLIKARALAVGVPAVPATEGTQGTKGNGCILALNATASGALTANGTSDVSSAGCSIVVNSTSDSALTATGNAVIKVLNPQSTDKAFLGVVGPTVGSGISKSSNSTITVQAPGTIAKISAQADPYSGVSNANFNSSTGRWTLAGLTSATACDLTAYSPGAGTYTIGPTNSNTLFVICGGMTLNAGVTVTLRPGIYIFNQGLMKINGNATLNGIGVTLIFTSSTGSNYATATINGGAIVTLSAPTMGPTKGLVFYGDHGMSAGIVFKLNGGSSQIINGAIYAARALVEFAGGSATSDACTQIVSDKITFTGNANFKIGCSNGAEAIGSTQGTPGTPGTPETVMLIE